MESKYEFFFVVELSQLEKDWPLKVKPILLKLLCVVKAEEIEEIFKELEEAINGLDEDKKVGDVPKDVKEAIGKITDLKKLSLRMGKSATAKDFDELREFLK